MATRKYDLVTKQTSDTLAQTMSDITYTYKETKVPKSHYKKVLDEVVEVEVSMQLNMSLLNVYVEMFKKINEESSEIFIKALLCLEKKISLGKKGIRPYELQALDETYRVYESSKAKSFISETLVGVFDDIIENGTCK